MEIQTLSTTFEGNTNHHYHHRHERHMIILSKSNQRHMPESSLNSLKKFMKRLGWLEITEEGQFAFEAQVTFLINNDFVTERLRVAVTTGQHVRTVKLMSSQVISKHAKQLEFDTQTYHMQLSPEDALVILSDDDSKESFVVWIRV